MYESILIRMLILHGCCAAIYAALIFFGISKLRKELILPILLVPLFGILAALVIEYIHRRKEDKGVVFDLHNFVLDKDAYWKTIIQRNEDTDILPLEEAVLINDNKTRRRLMLETLYHDPLKYVDVLMVAKNNEDIETAHYAATTISKIQRDFELAIQEFSIAVEKDPENPELIEQYASVQEAYINSGVLEDYLLFRQRLLYSKILEKKIKKDHADKSTFLKMISNCLALKDYDSANKYCDQLKKLTPSDEEAWIESIRVCVASMDKRKLEQTVKEIRNNRINWTKDGREQVSQWLIG